MTSSRCRYEGNSLLITPRLGWIFNQSISPPSTVKSDLNGIYVSNGLFSLNTGQIIIMSYDPYDNQDRRHRSDRHRESRRTRSNYREEELLGSRPSRHTALVPRREDSVEEVQREFPPGAGYGQRYPPGRRARSAERSRYEDDYYHDRRGGRRHEDRRSATIPKSIVEAADKQ